MQQLYISDVLGNVYDLPLDANDEISGFVETAENPVFGQSLPIETFGCSYTPPPETDDEGAGLPEVDESESAESLFLDEGVSINLADSSLDLNEDGSVNAQDLLDFLGSYGVTGDNLLADVDQDGAVTNADLLLILSGYGLDVEDSD